MSDFERLLDQNRRLTDEVKRRVDQLAAINSVATAVGQSLDLELTLQTALSAVLDVIAVEASGISLIDWKNNQLVLKAQRGWKRDFVEMGMRMPHGHGLAWYAIDHDQVVVTGDVSKDERIKHQAFQEEGILAQALAPMHTKGRVIGVLSAMSYKPYEFDKDELDILSAVADQIALAIDNARLYRDAVNHHNHLTAIMQSTAEVIIAVQPDGQVEIFNSSAEALFGLPADMVIGYPIEEVRLPAELIRGFQECRSRKKPVPMVFDGEHGLPEKRKVLSYALSPVFDEQENAYGCVAVVRDVTHIRDLEALRTQTIQTVSHDLRNPLSAVMNALDLLRKVTKDGSEQQERLITMAINSIERMQSTVKTLLSIEQIELGIKRDEDVAFQKLVDHVMLENQSLAGAKRIKMTSDLPEDLPTIRGNTPWLERALSNYLSNAVKFAPEESEIQIVGRVKDKEMQVEVVDHGPGIPVESQSRIFDRFYRIKQGQGDANGTGLGLTIVKRVVEQHAGRVYVISRPDEGSTFGFALPLE